MDKQRTLFVVPSLRRAGAEIQIIQLVNGLSGDLFEKHLLSYLPDDDLRECINAESVNYHKARRKRKLDLSVARMIASIIDEQEIDIVHCTLHNALFFGVLGAAYAVRKPALVAAIHTTKNVSLKHDLAEALLYRHLLKRCAQVWFMCRTQAENLIRRMPFLGDRQHIVYNGIDCERFDPNRFVQAGIDFRERLRIAQDARVVCCIAGLRPEKRQADLLHSFRKLSNTLTGDCYLLLAGSGPMERELRDIAGNLRLGNKVRFLGELSDVRPLLAAADCKVLCSVAETFSMAMLEAMAMGVPVLSTRVGGSGEAIMDGETGMLITPGNIDELAEKMEALMSDPPRLAEMGRMARQTITSQFSYKNMISRSSACLMSVAPVT